MPDPNHNMVDFERCVAFYRNGADARTNPALANWLDDHPETARRAQRHAAIEQHLENRYEPVFDEPIPRRLLFGSQYLHTRRVARAALAAIVVLALTGAWWLQPLHPYNHNTPLTVTQPVAGKSAEHGPHGLESAIAIQPPDLTAQGYTLVATRTRSRVGVPMLAFIYANRQGQRIRIYAHPQSQRGTRDTRLSLDRDSARIHWQHDGVDYLLVGQIPTQSLQSLARAVTNHAVNFPARRRVAGSGLAEAASTRNSPKAITPVIRGVQPRHIKPQGQRINKLEPERQRKDTARIETAA